MKNVVLIPKEKSFDMNYMKNIIEQLCSNKSNSGHLCCSGASMELRIEEDQIESLQKIRTENEIIYKVDNQGKIVRENI
jgi:hypothetical protein